DQQFAVLVDERKGPNRGLILQHPLFNRILNSEKRLPDRFQDYRISRAELPVEPAKQIHYADPMAKDPAGADFDKAWLAEQSPVIVRGYDSGLVVIVQQSYDAAIG